MSLKLRNGGLKKALALSNTSSAIFPGMNTLNPSMESTSLWLSLSVQPAVLSVFDTSGAVTSIILSLAPIVMAAIMRKLKFKTDSSVDVQSGTDRPSTFPSKVPLSISPNLAPPSEPPYMARLPLNLPPSISPTLTATRAPSSAPRSSLPSTTPTWLSSIPPSTAPSSPMPTPGPSISAAPIAVLISTPAPSKAVLSRSPSMGPLLRSPSALSLLSTTRPPTTTPAPFSVPSIKSPSKRPKRPTRSPSSAKTISPKRAPSYRPSFSPISSLPTMQPTAALPLQYHQDGIIMLGPITIYNIYFGHFKPVTMNLMDNLAKNIGNSSYWRTLCPYYQVIGGVKTFMPKNGPQTIFGGRFLYQPNKTSGNFTDGDIQKLVTSFIDQKKILSDSNAIYNVMFHGNLSACWWNCNPCPADCNVQPASAFHYFFDLNNTALKYTVTGDPTTSTPVNQGACAFPINDGPFLNNDPASTCMATAYIHELIETVTDPFPASAWYDDATGSENGDLCVNIYPGVTGLDYNIDLLGKQYLFASNYWPIPLRSGEQCVIAPPPVLITNVPSRVPTQKPSTTPPFVIVKSSAIFLILYAVLGVILIALGGFAVYYSWYVNTGVHTRSRSKNGTYQIIPGELGNEGQGFSSQTVSMSDKTTTGVYQAGGSTKRPFSAPGDHGIVVDVINSSGEVGRTPHDLNCHTDDVESGEQQN